jgi:putative ABC transport system permease protein
MHNLWQDLSFGVRMLRKRPGFTAVAVFALALGIGANATVFTIANTWLFQNLPFPDSARVLYISSVDAATGKSQGESYPDFRDFRAQSKTFEVLSAFDRPDMDVSDISGPPTQYKGAEVTADAFSLIDQKPMLGRGFLAEDARPGATPVVLLSYQLWANRYGEAGTIVGQSIRVNEIPRVVIGVMPPQMQFPGTSLLWIPMLPAGDGEKREFRHLTMFGRLARGANEKSARVEMTNLAARLAKQYPETNSGVGALVETYNNYFIDSDVKLAVQTLLGAVGFVLLIACANVANLLLARAVGRTREISVRTALGAARWRVMRQLLVESLLLSVAGGLVGSVLGIAGVRIYRTVLIPEETPSYMTFTMNHAVLAYLAAITVGTGILFGLAPALRLSKLDINAVLKDGGHGATAGSRARKLSTLLVVTEMALAFVLLVGAGVMIRSFLLLVRTPIGARTDHLMSMDIQLRPKRYPSEESQFSFHRKLQERLAALPGVERMAMASSLPGDNWTDFHYELDGAPPIDAHKRPRTGALIVSSSYFPLFEIRPRRGRIFAVQDGTPGNAVAVVNETFARVAFPRQEALGKRVRLSPMSEGAEPAPPQPWLTVVGIIPDIVQGDSSVSAHDPLVYVPYRQLPQRDMVVAARTVVPPENLSNSFRRAVQALDGDLPVTDLRTLDALLWGRTWGLRVYGGMFAIFGAMALLLAAVGLYAVMAHSVSLRTQEIGIRMAMGASRRNILWMVFVRGMRQATIGLALGLAASLALARALSAILVGVTPSDPFTLAAVAVVLTLAAVVGSAVPARRAVNVDPIVTLRYQ